MLPAILQPYAKRKVRVVAGYGDPELWALVELKHGKQHWELGPWTDVLRELFTCELSIEDWTASRQESTVDPCS